MDAINLRIKSGGYCCLLGPSGCGNVSLGIGLQSRLVDTAIKWVLTSMDATSTLEGYGTALDLMTSALGAHLRWTLPFGLLIMFAVFNPLQPRV